jgi:hypothetical protein
MLSNVRGKDAVLFADGTFNPLMTELGHTEDGPVGVKYCLGVGIDGQGIEADNSLGGYGTNALTIVLKQKTAREAFTLIIKNQAFEFFLGIEIFL